MRPPPLDLDAITARWKGYDGALTAVYSEEREAWVITAADDGCPDVGVVAEIETDDGQTVAHLWAGAGQAITALVAEAQKFRAERDALRTAILDLERDDAATSAHNDDCPGRDHAAGESCGWEDEGGWTCCEGLSERDCLATERSLCRCGLIAWRDRMRAAGELARGVRVAE